jgi:hypothetical protein
VCVQKGSSKLSVMAARQARDDFCICILGTTEENMTTLHRCCVGRALRTQKEVGQLLADFDECSTTVLYSRLACLPPGLLNVRSSRLKLSVIFFTKFTRCPGSLRKLIGSTSIIRSRLLSSQFSIPLVHCILSVTHQSLRINSIQVAGKGAIIWK